MNIFENEEIYKIRFVYHNYNSKVLGNLSIHQHTDKTTIFSPEYIEKLVKVFPLLFPVIIIELIASGYIGHKTYRRLYSVNQ